jgi:hypothetical protein
LNDHPAYIAFLADRVDRWLHGNETASCSTSLASRA